MITLEQLFIAVPVGILLVWGAYRLHARMFPRTAGIGSGLDVLVLLVMVATGLLLALSLAKALG
ncbi:MAG: hypothetical protein NDI84_09665 [Steroidobacteraceae bacterium]|nr:hypothetical protein [Steroidobacteraceae bacterium]